MKIGVRTYSASDVAAFRFSSGPLGPLSNFARGMSLDVPSAAGAVRVDSSETFYQLMKFVHRPDLQEGLLAAANAHENGPRGGKDFATAHAGDVTPDWVRGLSVVAMRAALRLKLAQHRAAVTAAIAAAGGLPIVEFSTRDAFWGAKPAPGGALVGNNVLGRLWMEIRSALEADPDFCAFRVPAPPGLLLMGAPLAPWVRTAEVLNAHVVGRAPPGAVYVGRPSDFGNPFRLTDEAGRGATLDDYAAWLSGRADLVARMRAELAGRDLVCWCAPRPCHAMIIAHVAAGGDVPGPGAVADMIAARAAPESRDPDPGQGELGL